MEVHTPSMVPSTSNESSSLTSQQLVRVCSRCHRDTLIWPGSSKSNICDRCLAVIGTHNTPRDATSRAHAKNTSCIESTLNDPNDVKEAAPVAPAILGLAVDSASPPKYPPLTPYLLPSSQPESTHDFELEAEISDKRSGHISTSVSESSQGRQSVISPSSTISVPLYNYYGLYHKPNVSDLTTEQNRTHHRLCRVCRTIISSHPTETICPRCRFDAASFKKTDIEQYESKGIVAESNPEDDLLAAVMSIFSNPDENLDDTDDAVMEGVELSYPEDSGAVEEPQLEPTQESSSYLEGNLVAEKVPQHSNPVDPDLALTLPRKQNILRSLKLCSTAGCTGIISSESLATRCLGCVRRDWKSKKAKVRASLAADDGRLSSGIMDRSISTKQKTKKAVTWADEVSHILAPQEKLECNTTAKQHQPNMPSMESSSKYAISRSHSADFPILIDDGSPVGLNVPVDKVPPPADIQASSKRSESPIIRLNDSSSESLSVFTHTQEDFSAPASSTVVELVSNDGLWSGTQAGSVRSVESSTSFNVPSPSEVAIFGDVSDFLDGGDDNKPDKDPSSSNLQKTCPPSISTGLKIRIPPRPGLYVRKCGSIQCQRRLPATYRWKSCVICRARSRYQCMSQNRQGRWWLEEEPLWSRDINIDPPAVVAGARLCSVGNCTHIIPPSREYLWKTCALCRLRARSSQKFENTSSLVRQDETSSRQFNSTAKVEHLPRREKRLPGRCQSLDCGMLLSGAESALLDCDQCTARRPFLTNDQQALIEGKAQSIPPHLLNLSKSLDLSPYPRYKAFTTLLADFQIRFNDLLKVQSVSFFRNTADSHRSNSAKTIFIFDGEYSMVALDFDIVGQKKAVDGDVMKIKEEIARVGRILFSTKRYISILEDGGISERFFCLKEIPGLQAVSSNQSVSAATHTKNIRGELEIAVVPDRSHPFLPGQRTIVRFRLLG